MTVMTESGIKEKLRQRWWRSEPCAAETPLTAYRSIGLWEVGCSPHAGIRSWMSVLWLMLCHIPLDVRMSSFIMRWNNYCHFLVNTNSGIRGWLPHPL